MLDGPAAGRSSRIVGYYYDSVAQVSYFQALSFDGIAPNSGDHFLVNRRPFAGTGFGFRPLAFQQNLSNITYTRLLDAMDPGTIAFFPNFNPSNVYSSNNQPIYNKGAGLQYALLPNPRRGVFSPLNSGTPLTAYLDPAGPGGANEDYDPPDFQNMLLAMRVWSSQSGTLVTPLPSLHRPDLIQYWNNRWKNQPLSASSQYLIAPVPGTVTPAPTTFDAISSSGNPTNFASARNLLRKIVLRPLSFVDDPTTANVDESENPNFTGSNPAFNLLTGPWDVDNNGDGVPDSVWVDLGMPVQTAPDGPALQNHWWLRL